jgi:ribosome-binding ATPase
MAETVSFEDLDGAGIMNGAEAAGEICMDGKEFVMQAGDVV